MQWAITPPLTTNFQMSVNNKVNQSNVVAKPKDWRSKTLPPPVYQVAKAWKRLSMDGDGTTKNDDMLGVDAKNRGIQNGIKFFFKRKNTQVVFPKFLKLSPANLNKLFWRSVLEDYFLNETQQKCKRLCSCRFAGGQFWLLNGC